MRIIFVPKRSNLRFKVENAKKKKMPKKNQKLFFVPDVNASENVAISCF